MQPSNTCVITVTYRGAIDTASCVRSLLASEAPVEIVVVDTTPNDPELSAALEFAPNVTLIRAGDNIGFGRGNNLGIQSALANSSCEFIFLLNNDAVVYPQSIGFLEDALAEDSGIGIATPRIAYLDDPEKLWYGGGIVDWRRASAFTPGFNGSIDAPLAVTERDVTFASGCALFFRRSVLQRLGGFNPAFFMYEEDVELCLRATEKGFRIRYIPRSLILHRAQGSDPQAAKGRQNLWSVQNVKLPFYAFHIMRNRVLNVYLHARGRNLLTVMVFFPLLIVRRAMDAVMAMFKGMADSWRARQSAGVTG
jgi:GT2 family glycosyltransferase